MQPDLNYRNPTVKAAMLDVVRHWLQEGADGLRLDIFNAIFKDESFKDNPFSWRAVPSETNPHGYFQWHRHTIDHPDTLAFARELRRVVDEYDGPSRFLVGEVFGNAETLRQYCGEAADGLHLVFLFQALRTRARARDLTAMVQEFERAFPEPFSPTYVFGNHDRPRSIHRVHRHLAQAKLVAMLQLTVRGVPFIYYGEEIGMENHDIPLHEGLDPVAARFRFIPRWLTGWMRQHGILLNRDECRTPMQWDSTPNAGFTRPGVKPWLPVHPHSPEINVAAQEHDPASLWCCYRNLLALRREQPALQAGGLEWEDGGSLPGDVMAFRRALDGQSVRVFLNFGKHERLLDLSAHARTQLFSNRQGERQPAPARYALGPFEGIALLDAPGTS
jgi:oligo-1,6-glucosidase/alpha-glucosidase